MADPTDGELVGLTRGGAREPFGTLVARYQGHVYGLAYSLAGNWAEAQDIAQEAFVRAYVNLDQLREPERFAAWLRRVTFSVAMNWLKAHRPDVFGQLEGRVDLDTLEVPDFRPGPAEVVERRELAEAVLSAVGSLPPKYRVPLTMFHLDGLSYQKVADFLDIPLGTAKSLIHRARAKLKEALYPYAAPELGPVVQEVFNEHKLPEEFARKVLENVPTLGWGTGRECTFAGALEAALAPTAHPYTYTDIMGFSGLAFRVRWHHENDEARWCGSCAVGEMPEEIEAVQRATGWQFRIEVLFGDDATNVGRLAPDIAASINGDRPVLAYDKWLNMGVVYGYEEGGERLLVRSYSSDDLPPSFPASELGAPHHRLIIFLSERIEPLAPRAAAAEALRIAVRNWQRERFAPIPVEYWYGKAALEHWLADIGEAEDLPEDDRGKLGRVTWWNFAAMHDARKAAVTFLGEGAEALGGEAAKGLGRTADIYAEEVKLFDAVAAEPHVFGGAGAGWTAEVRRRERETLSRAIELEEKAIAEIERALEQLPVIG
ncbi:MAG: sigma-70 family RNA polymerase sigma factor [Armatimonadota bacterium]|nr:MAG: sigma-70 family RNA polymerase sigma factor [Armatimonadota bacterium]